MSRHLINRTGKLSVDPPAEHNSHHGGRCNFWHGKSNGVTSNFSPAYRAPSKNIVELEKRTGREFSGVRQLSTFVAVRSYSKPILYGFKVYGSRDAVEARSEA